MHIYTKDSVDIATISPPTAGLGCTWVDVEPMWPETPLGPGNSSCAQKAVKWMVLCEYTDTIQRAYSSNRAIIYIVPKNLLHLAMEEAPLPPPISAEWPNIPIPPILLISLFNQSTKSCWTIHSHTLTGKCNYNFLCRQHTLSRQSLIPYSMLFADHSNL